MDTQFCCKTEGRRRAVRAHDTLNGIDYLEVLDDASLPQKDRQRKLLLHFIKPLAHELSEKNVSIEGGVRSTNIRVKKVDSEAPDTLMVELYERGDFSTYTLRLVELSGNGLAAASDEIGFSASAGDPAQSDLGFQSATQIKGVLSAELAAYVQLTNDPAKIKVKIVSEGPHEVEILGRPADLATAAVALQTGIRTAHPSAAFTGARVVVVRDQLFVLTGTPTDTAEFLSSGEDPALRELGLHHTSRVQAVMSSDLSGFAGLTNDPAKLNVKIGPEGPHEVEIIGDPADLDAAGAVLGAGIRAAYSSAPFTGARVSVTTDDRLIVLPGVERFDPALLAIDFSFKVGCPSEFDCKPVVECPPQKLTEPEINYLAKDYASFRRLMLDRMSVIMPDWRERSAADAQIALVELLAYVGDHLSYFQDAAATEAYLGTARMRISVRRHARLLDYVAHDGCNSRVWVCLEVKEQGGADGAAVRAHTPLLTFGSNGQTVVREADLEKVLLKKPLVFETMHDLTLRSAHNTFSFYTWSDSQCCLPAGSTRATLLDNTNSGLVKGDVLIFEEVSGPVTGVEADADPAHRHAVRLKSVTPPRADPLNGSKVVDIEWHEEDALPFPLCLTAEISDADKTKVTEISVAHGNTVLADYGQTHTNESLVPEIVPAKGDYRPQLSRGDISFSVPYDHDKAIEAAAATALQQDPDKALPSRLILSDGDESWIVRRDLLASDRFAADFVVEIEQNGIAQLRFGDDVSGKKPPETTTFKANYRIGNGRAGNVGAETITRIVSDLDDISWVRNPLPASGGTNMETMEQVRQFAPHAFRTQERAVTETDYADVAQRHPEVQKATAKFRWTGSWYTVFVTIDRRGGWEVKEEFKTEIREHLERFRLAGYDIEVNGPVFVPLDILLMICVKPEYFRSHVKTSLLKAFSRYDLVDGQRGFFHPDKFTFGQPVYLSQLYQRALEVAGVASVGAKRFQRWGKKANREKEDGVLKPEDLEVIRLDNDLNFPENGKIEFDMQGGL